MHNRGLGLPSLGLHTVCHLCLEPRVGFKHDLAMGAVISATVESSHSSCKSLVVYYKPHNHEITCPHAPCACLEHGCGFAVPSAELVVHLAEVHSIKVHKLPPYATTKVFHDGPMVVQGRPCRRLIAQGEDGTIFVLTICAQVPTTIVSIVCVRANAIVWPEYMVSMWAERPSTPSADRMSRTDTVTVLLEASRSVVSGDVVLDNISSYLSVPPAYLSGERFKTLCFSIRIHKENDPCKGTISELLVSLVYESP